MPLIAHILSHRYLHSFHYSSSNGNSRRINQVYRMQRSTPPMFPERRWEDLEK